MIPRRVLVVGSAVGVTLLGDSLLYVALPLHGPALGLSLTMVGILLSANRLIRPFVNSLDARLYERMGVARPFTFATVLAVVTTTAYALVPLFWPLLIARVLWGIAWSLLRMGAYLTIIEDTAPIRRARSFGAFNGLARAGSLVSVIVGGILVDLYGFRTAVVVFGILTLISVALGLLAGRLRPAAIVEDKQATDGGQRSGVQVCSRTAVIVAGFSYSIVLNGVVTTTIGLLLAHRLGPAGAVTTIAGLVIAIRWLSDVGLSPVAGVLSDRIGRPRALPLLLICGAGLVAALAAPVPIAGTVVIAALVFFFGTGMHVNGEAAAGDIAVAEGSNHILGRYATAIDLGAAIGPLAALPLVGLIGLDNLYVISALLLGVAGLFAISWRRSPIPVSANQDSH